MQDGYLRHKGTWQCRCSRWKQVFTGDEKVSRDEGDGMHHFYGQLMRNREENKSYDGVLRNECIVKLRLEMTGL